MFWIVTLLMSVVIPIIFCSLLSMHWESAMNPDNPVTYELNRTLLYHTSVYEPRFPHHDGFWDLKWSIIRHAFVYFVFSIIIYLDNTGFVPIILQFIYLLYTLLVLFTYYSRKKILAKMKDENCMEIWSFCSKLVRPYKIVLIYSLSCSIALFLITIIHTNIPDGIIESTTNIAVQESIEPTVKQLTPQDRPLSGTINSAGIFNTQDNSEITIHTSSKDCVVRLKTPEGIVVSTFYVRSNDTVTISVPPKELYVYFAQGDQWYGWRYLFGEDTIYSMDSNPVDFSSYTIEYTLYGVTNGNFSMDYIDPEDF